MKQGSVVAKIKAMLPFLLCIVLDFYLLPLLINSTGMGMLLLLVLIPLICLACSVVYGLKHSFNILYIALVVLLFFPTIFIFYNASAWVYTVAYGIIALIGNAIGMIFYKRNSAVELFERSKALDPEQSNVDMFITSEKEFVAYRVAKAAADEKPEEAKIYPEYWELHLEKAEVPENKNDYFDNDLSPAFFLDISNTDKGLCYDCTLNLSEDESEAMAGFRARLVQRGFDADGSAWKAYFLMYFIGYMPSLLKIIETDTEDDACSFFVYSRDAFYMLLEAVSTAVRALYAVTPPQETPEIEYLPEMYEDDYYPDALVDHVKAELSAVVDFIMSGVHTYEEIQLKFDDCVKAINDLQEMFGEHDSEIETIARDSIGDTVKRILEAFGIDIDVETAIRERDW